MVRKYYFFFPGGILLSLLINQESLSSQIAFLGQKTTHMKITNSINSFGISTGLALGAVAVQASTDYGPATWRANCGQYSSSGNGHKFVVCHDMEGYYASTISYFQNCGT